MSRRTANVGLLGLALCTNQSQANAWAMLRSFKLDGSSREVIGADTLRSFIRIVGAARERVPGVRSDTRKIS
ncbi:hypothetical protein [Hydrocarboniphaga sp.]|uniref:hypothetical protein n=1 Tax=Hydrocarboniphaga sp. TaxID=2033016 RepID=UPI0026090632|nr:hypothetical protein [Hydrocarboniphaga sp.]